MTREERQAIRQAVADYIRSEGCDCCSNRDAHKEARNVLGKLLRVPKYADGSGYDFSKFATPRRGR